MRKTKKGREEKLFSLCKMCRGTAYFSCVGDAEVAGLCEVCVGVWKFYASFNSKHKPDQGFAADAARVKENGLARGLGLGAIRGQVQPFVVSFYWFIGFCFIKLILCTFYLKPISNIS